jgi:hypothetical protein
MNRKDLLKFNILFDFIYIYIASFFSIYFIILSFKYAQSCISDPIFLTAGIAGIVLFLSILTMFEDCWTSIEELTKLKIKGGRKK